jgi:hypothetical protein
MCHNTTLFSKTDPISGRNSDSTAIGKCGNTDESVVIIWDGLNEEERESAMRWMTTSKPWVLWKQQDSLTTRKKIENTVEGKLQSLLEECGWSLTDKEGKTKKGSKKNRRETNTGTDGASESEYGGEAQNEGWTGGLDSPETRGYRSSEGSWMCESGKDQCVHTSVGLETTYWWGTEFSRMGGYDFPGQICGSD